MCAINRSQEWTWTVVRKAVVWTWLDTCVQSISFYLCWLWCNHKKNAGSYLNIVWHRYTVISNQDPGDYLSIIWRQMTYNDHCFIQNYSCVTVLRLPPLTFIYPHPTNLSSSDTQTRVLSLSRIHFLLFSQISTEQKAIQWDQRWPHEPHQNQLNARM